MKFSAFLQEIRIIQDNGIDNKVNKTINDFQTEILKLQNSCKKNGNFYNVLARDGSADLSYLKDIIKKLNDIESDLDDLHRSAVKS